MILEPVFNIARQNGPAVGLAAVDHNPLRPTGCLSAVLREGLAVVRFHRSLNQNPILSSFLPMARYICIHRPRTLLHLIDMLLRTDGLLAPIEPLEKLG